MPHFNELINPNFLSNIDFINTNGGYDRKIVTIKSVTKETVHNGKGGSDQVATIHFHECKPLILSNRNLKTIIRTTRKVNTDDWIGLRLELTILENQKAFGSVWDVVRVSNAMQAAPKQAVDYTQQTKALKACTTLTELQETYMSFTKAEREDLVRIKDEMKIKLNTPL